MSTAHVLLGLLVPGALHGYELKRAHDLRLPGTKPLAFGQVYATLHRLVRDGLVAEASQDRDGGPDRTSYAVTEDGRAALMRWLEVVEPPAPYATGGCSPRLSWPCSLPMRRRLGGTSPVSGPRISLGCGS